MTVGKSSIKDVLDLIVERDYDLPVANAILEWGLLMDYLEVLDWDLGTAHIRIKQLETELEKFRLPLTMTEPAENERWSGPT